MDAPFKVLFMCVANSARSQLAEGLAKRILGPLADVRSAGSQPKGVNPFAIAAMKEVGIDLSNHRSKSVDDLPRDFFGSLDFLITLCAEEVCPFVPSQASRLHWPLPDPAGGSGSDAERLDRFRSTRDQIAARLDDFKGKLEAIAAERQRT